MHVWEYRLRPEAVDRFLSAYGPEGDWVKLFRQGTGHLGTELLRDLSNGLHFVTLDTWESEAAYLAFRGRFAAEYADLDARCSEWTTEERELARSARG